MTFPRRFLRFSLRTLLIAVTALCVWIGAAANLAHRQQPAINELASHGGQFEYDYQFIVDQRAQPLGKRRVANALPSTPAWMRTLIGDQYFVTPISLSITDQNWDNGDHLAYLGDLPNLESLRLTNVRLRNSDLKSLPRLEKLKVLILRSWSLPTDEPVHDFEFLTHFPELANLGLGGSLFSDKDVRYVSGLRKLRWLQLPNTKVGDAGLAQLNDLPRLEMLLLAGTSITDAGLVHLRSLPNLKDLDLSYTAVSRDGVAALRAALPICHIRAN